MKLLANENFPTESVHILRNLGYDIKAIGEDEPAISDEKVINIAEMEKRLILTFDKDYGELIFRLNFRPSNGVIFLRLEQYKPSEPAIIIDYLLKNPSLAFENTLTVYDGDIIRQRRY